MIPEPPKVEWNEEDECWQIRVSQYITVQFLEEERVRVMGSLMSMKISYDQMTEERGILFEEERLDYPKGSD